MGTKWTVIVALMALNWVVGCGDAPLSPTKQDIVAETVAPGDADIGALDAADDAGAGADVGTDGADATPDAVPDDGPDAPTDTAAETSDAADAAEASDAVDDGDAGQPDVGPSCETPIPFVAPGQPTGWDHTSTELFTVTQGKANHRGQDVVTTADAATQLLIGKFAYGIFDKDLKDEVVEVFIQADAPCGQWVSKGTFKTTEDGEFGTQYPVEDDGGRVFWELTGADRLPVGVHRVVMLVHGDHSSARFNVFVFAPDTKGVVFDIDGTLTTTDAELIPSLVNEIFNGTYIPEMYTGAQDAVWAWFDKGYQIVYLTARPDFLEIMTHDAHVAAGFPPGVLHLSDTTTEFVSAVASYKADFLARLASVGVNLVAAYGNATTDVEAYEMAGLDKQTTFIIGTNGGSAGTVPLSSYPDNMPFIQMQPDASGPAPSIQQW